MKCKCDSYEATQLFTLYAGTMVVVAMMFDDKVMLCHPLNRRIMIKLSAAWNNEASILAEFKDTSWLAAATSDQMRAGIIGRLMLDGDNSAIKSWDTLTWNHKVVADIASVSPSPVEEEPYW